MSLIIDMKVKVDDSKTSSCISLHPDHGKYFHMEDGTAITLQFGHRIREVHLRLSKGVRPNELLISKKTRDLLCIPLFCSYQLRKQEQSFILGPFIGILVKDKEGVINLKRLEGYARMCSSLKGAILAFSSGRVNVNLKAIKGFTYDSSKKEWKSGVYGYPSSIVKLDRMSRKVHDALSAELEGCIFNDLRWNKLQMIRYLQRFPRLRPFLPETILYRNPKSVFRMLDRHGEIYLKPVIGSGGRGIFKIVKTPLGYTVSNWTEGTKSDLSSTQSRTELVSFLLKSLEGRRYIVQQGIRMLEEKGRVVDFRCIIVKNGQGCWQEIGLVSRYSRSGSIVSNVSAGGRAESGEASLKKLLRLDDHQVDEIRRCMSALAYETVTSLDSSGGHWGNIGLDFACDPSGKLWLIEVNHNNPDHTVALDAGDEEMYLKATEAVMQYAKRLANLGKGLY